MKAKRTLVCFASTMLVIALAGAFNRASAQESEDSVAADQNTETTAALPGILPAFITAGLPDPTGKVPALDAVPGSRVANLSMAQPMTVLEHGKYYAYLVALQANSYSGKYSIAYRLIQVVKGKTKTLESGTIASDKTTEPGDYWAWVAYGKDIPDSPGLATLEAIITYGKSTATVSTTVVIK